MERAVALAFCDLALGLGDGDCAGFPCERGGEQVGSCEDGLALGEVLDGPVDGPVCVGLCGRRVARIVAGRRGRFVDRVSGGGFCGGLCGERACVEAEFCGLLLPARAQGVLVDVAFVGAGEEGGALREARVFCGVADAAAAHGGLDLGAARGEGVDDRARDAGDLEASVGMGFFDVVADASEFAREFAAIHGADEHLGGVEFLVGDGAPFSVLALDHVGDDGVGVELGVEVARCVVGECGGDRLLSPGANDVSGLRVLHAGFDGVFLDPGEGAPDGGLMGGGDAHVAAHQRGEGDGFRGGESDVAARSMDDGAFPVASSEALARSVRDLAFEDGLEGFGVDGSGEAEFFRALAGPCAGGAVGGVVPGVVAVAFVVGDALGRRGDGADGGDHQ